MPRRLALLILPLVLLAVLPASAAAAKLSPGETVDLNAAGFDDLLRVPGIGKTKARAILDYRADHGPFRSVDDLDNVKGFGKKSVKKLSPWLRVGGDKTHEPAPTEPVREQPRPGPDAGKKPVPPREPEETEVPILAPPKDQGKGTNDVEVL